MRKPIDQRLIVLFGVVALMAAALPASADPSDVDGTFNDLDVPVWCPIAGETIFLDIVGWVGSVQQVDHVKKNHLRLVYTNQDGDRWQYIDTNTIHFRDGLVALAGHSVNVGPDGTGWYGLWANDGTLVGKAQGDVEEAACAALTG